MPARFEDSLLRSKLGDMPISGEMRLRLGNPNDRNVILGVRPENFEDASFVPEHDQGHGMTFSATIDVVESMGSDLFVYFALEGGPARSAELDELAVDSGRADTGSDGDQIVARLDAATQIREGETARLWVDVRAVHVFDINSGENLTHPQRVMSAAVVGT